VYCGFTLGSFDHLHLASIAPEEPASHVRLIRGQGHVDGGAVRILMEGVPRPRVAAVSPDESLAQRQDACGAGLSVFDFIHFYGRGCRAIAPLLVHMRQAYQPAKRFCAEELLKFLRVEIPLMLRALVDAIGEQSPLAIDGAAQRCTRGR
jgi:hypothetical protein